MSNSQLKANLLFYYSKYTLETKYLTDINFSFDESSLVIRYKFDNKQYVTKFDIKYLTTLSTNDYTIYQGTGRGIDCDCVTQLITVKEGCVFTNSYRSSKNGKVSFTNNDELINKVPEGREFYIEGVPEITLNPIFKKSYRQYKTTLLEFAKRIGNSDIKFHELGNL